MTGFRHLFFVALIAGLAAGLATSVVQAGKLWPLIAAAEVLEAGAAPTGAPPTGASPTGAGHAPAQGHAHDHGHTQAQASPRGHAHDHGGAHDHGWSPEGPLRHALTVLFNIAAGLGFGLILNALARLRALSAGGAFTATEGVLWGIAGFAAFALAPAVGLPPELPGMAAGELVHRQIWWVGTALCSAGAIALWVFVGGPWRAIAVLLAVAPHLVGVPHAHKHGAVPGELGAAFAAASLAASAVFWVVLGGVSGWAQTRWRQTA